MRHSAHQQRQLPRHGVAHRVPQGPADSPDSKTVGKVGQYADTVGKVAGALTGIYNVGRIVAPYAMAAMA